MSELATFCNGNHPLSVASDNMSYKLMPMSGNCATLQGELYRASTRISYDWFNNGWGCNNWSGAVVFLQKFFSELPVQPSAETLHDLDINLSFVHDYSHGEPASHLDGSGVSDKVDATVTRIHEIVVQAILDNPTPILNTRDMFDFQEKDAPYEDDADEENYDEDEDARY